MVRSLLDPARGYRQYDSRGGCVKRYLTSVFVVFCVANTVDFESTTLISCLSAVVSEFATLNCRVKKAFLHLVQGSNGVFIREC